MGSIPIDSTSECVSASYQLLLDNTKHRLNDLQQRFSNLQAARREEGQANDILVLEEQVFEILRDWKSELSSFSPASSLLGISIGSLDHLLQVCDKDDATSALSEQPPLKPEISLHNTVLHNAEISIPDSTTLLDYQQMDMYQESENGHLVGADFTEECRKVAEPSVLPYIRPPPSAFMGPKCALWDCLRPALGSEWYRDYCSSFHATLSLSEESTGLTPVVQPGGFHLKDSLLLVAANAKAQGKNVGIPKCEGAATATPPNHLMLLEGETVKRVALFR